MAPSATAGLLDDDGQRDAFAQARDLRLQVGLLVLGVVVLAVLLEVPPFARGLDALGDLTPPLALKGLELGAQRLQPLVGDHVPRVAHRPHTTGPWPFAPSQK